MGCIKSIFCPEKKTFKDYEAPSENNDTKTYYRETTKLSGANIKQSKNENNPDLLLKKCKKFLSYFPKLKTKTEIECLNEKYKLFENDIYIIELCIKDGIFQKNEFVLDYFKHYIKIQKMISEFEDILSLKLQSDIMKFNQKLKDSEISGKLGVTYKNDSLIFKLEIKDEEYNRNYYSSYGIIELIIKFKREKELKKMKEICSKKDNYGAKIFIFLLVIIILIIELIMIDNVDEILSKKNWGENENNFNAFFEGMQD